MSLGDSGGFLFSLDSSNQDQIFDSSNNNNNNNNSNHNDNDISQNNSNSLQDNITIINNINNTNSVVNIGQQQQQQQQQHSIETNEISELNGNINDNGIVLDVNNELIMEAASEGNDESNELILAAAANGINPNDLIMASDINGNNHNNNGNALNESNESTNNSTTPTSPNSNSTTSNIYQQQQQQQPFFIPTPPPPPPPPVVPHYQTLQQPSVIYTQLLQQQQKKLRPVTERSQDDKKKEALNFLNFYFRVSPSKKTPTISRSTVLALYTNKISIDKRYKQPNDMANLCGAVYTFIFQNLEDDTLREYITSAENERLATKNDVKKRKRKKNHDVSNGILNNHESFLTCIKYATLLPYLEFVHSSELSAQHYGIDFKYNHPNWTYTQEDLAKWEGDLKDQKQQGGKKINSVDDDSYPNNLNTQLTQNTASLMSLNNSSNNNNNNNSNNNNNNNNSNNSIGTPSLSSSGSNFKTIDLADFEMSQNNAFSNSILNNTNNNTTTTTTTTTSTSTSSSSSSSSSTNPSCNNSNSTPFVSSSGTTKKGVYVNYFKMNSIPVNVIENNEHFIIYAFIPFYKPNALKIIVNQMDIILEGVISLPDTIQIPNGSEIYVPTSFVNCKQMDIQEGHFSKVIRLTSPIAGSIVGKRDGVVVIICKKEDKASTVHHL